MCCIISVFFSSKCRLFHNATFFGSRIIHILNTECAKIWKEIPTPKGLTVPDTSLHETFHLM